MNMLMSKPWLKSPRFDLTFILLPSLISAFIAFIFADVLGNTTGVPFWAWLIFILGIDVSHVYSTLFRTYFNSNELNENKSMLTLIPVVVWLIGVGLYSVNNMLFWRVLTYVAVFHFIRQQYGFLRLYCRGEDSSKKDRWLSALVVYLAALYPIIYWHSHQPRNFHWFIDDDFIVGLPAVFSQIFGFLYLVVLVWYFVNEIINAKNNRPFNIPKNAIVLGTAISWYVGIVHFNGDMTFTITNVVSHGIPYMALVWLYGERQKDKPDCPLILGKFPYKMFFSKISIPLFLAVLLLFGFLEEGLWAGLVWREHLEAFGVLGRLPEITAKDTLSWLVPLLTLPQATHYVLDGFIWKLKDSEANWQNVLFAKRLGA
jgi:hypothetical protein